MFSGIPQKNRAGAESYFDEHLSQNDYYTQEQTNMVNGWALGQNDWGCKRVAW
jgi:hypothetical protein